MTLFRSTFIALSIVTLYVAASAQQTIRIHGDFVPDINRLEFVSGDDLHELYVGTTVRGIYQSVWQSDQRFVETHNADMSSDYIEPDQRLTGRWFIRGDFMCYTYPEDVPGLDHCYAIYRYGSCIISFPHDAPRLAGYPMFPSYWHSIHVYTEAGYRWPDRSISTEDELACQLNIA